MGSKRRNHSPEFKTQVALQALIGQKTLADIADIYDVHPVQVCQWKQQLVKRLPELYCKTGAASPKKDIIQSKENLAKLKDINGKLIQELDWLKKNFYTFNQNTLRSVTEPDNPRISLRRQCELIGITRSGYYYRQRPTKQKILETMHLIDGFCEGNERASYPALMQYLRANNHVISKSSLHNQLCGMGYAAFERKLIKSACNGLIQIPVFPLQQEEAEMIEEQWVFDIAFWPCHNAVRFAALLIDSKLQRCLAWGLSDSPTPKLAIELFKIAMNKYQLPLILRSESYLPLFNEYFLRLLKSKAITFMAPRWISKHKGAGRSTLLSPLWKSLKQQVRELQELYPDANSEWLLSEVIKKNLS
jgi:putative transposase